MEYHRLASEEENFSNNNDQINNMDVDKGENGEDLDFLGPGSNVSPNPN
jgi:hypothetical protein